MSQEGIQACVNEGQEMNKRQRHREVVCVKACAAKSRFVAFIMPMPVLFVAIITMRHARDVEAKNCSTSDIELGCYLKYKNRLSHKTTKCYASCLYIVLPCTDGLSIVPLPP